MADMDELEIQIDDEGNVTIKVVNGPGGADCLKLTKEIEEALGLVAERELTAEYYEEKTEAEGQIELGGGQ